MWGCKVEPSFWWPVMTKWSGKARIRSLKECIVTHDQHEVKEGISISSPLFGRMHEEVEHTQRTLLVVLLLFIQKIQVFTPNLQHSNDCGRSAGIFFFTLLHLIWLHLEELFSNHHSVQAAILIHWVQTSMNYKWTKKRGVMGWTAVWKKRSAWAQIGKKTSFPLGSSKCIMYRRRAWHYNRWSAYA